METNVDRKIWRTILGGRKMKELRVIDILELAKYDALFIKKMHKNKLLDDEQYNLVLSTLTMEALSEISENHGGKKWA